VAATFATRPAASSKSMRDGEPYAGRQIDRTRWRVYDSVELRPVRQDLQALCGGRGVESGSTEVSARTVERFHDSFEPANARLVRLASSGFQQLEGLRAALAIDLELEIGLTAPEPASRARLGCQSLDVPAQRTDHSFERPCFQTRRGLGIMSIE
jgi:hypothetical protein